MTRKIAPFDLWAQSYELWATAIEAQSVVAMRMMGMAGIWNVTPFETTRMITEKPEVFGRAAMAASIGMMTGQRPDRIMRSATQKIRRKTRSNARRLAKRGVNFPES